MRKVLRAWDTEAVVGSGYLRDVNPYVEGNWVVSHAWADFTKEPSIYGGQKVYMTPVTERYYHSPPEDGWLGEVLEGCDILAGANLKFDLSLALYKCPKNYEHYRAWVNRGGRIWDVLQAEYILEGHEEKSMYLNLNQVAVRYGGNLKHDQVSALIKSGTPVNKIDRRLLSEYLCGIYTDDICEHGDIGNTMLVAYKQMAQAKRDGVLEWMKVEMLGLQCTTEMEINGCHIDSQKAEEARARAVQRLQDAQKALEAYIPEGNPDLFSWGSWKDKSRLLYGGEKEVNVPGWKNIHDEVRDRPWPIQLQAYAKESYKVCRYDENWQPILNKGGKNKGEAKLFKEDGINPSKPKTKQTTRTIIFPRRIDPPEGCEASEEGFWKTDADTLEHLPAGDSVVDLIREVTTWLKDISVSYYSIREDGSRKGGTWEATMPDSTIHPSFKHNGTITGRLSSSSPNWQNLSKVGELKTCLTSRYPDGVIVQGDATSLENYVMLWLSGCSGYYTLINEGLDVHSYVACSGNKEEAIALKKAVDAGDTAAKQRRQDAKGVNFSMGYGGGVKSIAYTNKMTEEKVQEMMDGNRKAFKEYWAFQDSVYEAASSSIQYDGEVRRHPLKPSKMYRTGYGVWKAPHGIHWRYPLTPTPLFVLDRSGQCESISPTQAKNLHVQGTGASYMKAAMAVFFLLYMKQPALRECLPIATVHDAFYLDAPANLKERAGNLVQASLMGANQVLTAAGIDVKIPVPAVTTVGPCWKEMPGDLTVDPKSDKISLILKYISTHTVKEIFQ